MINELKEFWSRYKNYSLHPDDQKYLGNKKDQFCLDITIDELREKYGTDLKSDNTRESFLKDKFNKNKILTSLSVVPFFGDVENAKIYILMGNPGFHTGDYVDEIENKDYINLIEQNLKLQLKTFKSLHKNAINTGGYRYWSQKGRIPKISKLLTELNSKDEEVNYDFVKKSICIIESIAYHSCNKPDEELFNLPSSKMTKRLVNEHVQQQVDSGEAMCFVWRSVAFWQMKQSNNLLIRDPKKAQLSMFSNIEATVMAEFLNNVF